MAIKTRNFKRCHLETYIEFPDLPRSFDWHVVNVSPNGCQVSGNVDLHLDDEVACVLTIPHSATDIEITSKVVWKAGNTYGLQFQEMPAGMKFRLAVVIYGRKKAA